MATVFTTGRLIVRFYNNDDSDNFFLLNGDEEVMRYIRPAKTRDESDQFLQEVIHQYSERAGMGRFAVNEKDTGIFVGSFALLPVEGEDKCHLGYALLPDHWGKGYATELAREGLNYFFTNGSYPEIYGYTETANKESQKVLLKAGFTFDSIKEEKGKELIIFIFRQPG